MSPVPIRIHLFGPPEFRVNGEPIARLRTRKGLNILALLALRHDRDVERVWLAGTLWPEKDEAVALTYLRQSLVDLRHALGDGAERLLSPSPRTLRLDVSGAADVDILTFRQCLKRGDTASLEQAVSLYRGPLLEGWVEDWLVSERETATQAYLGALETLAQQAIQADRADTPSAVRYLREIVTTDPLRESASRALMQALASTRDYGAVTQVYRTLRAVLRREVNAEPDTETQALFARLRAEAKTQAAASSRIEDGCAHIPVEPSAPGNHSVHLPRPLSEFIGRVREVEGVRRAIMTTRLVTLTGMGGVGKTRLSLRVAEEAAEEFPDGVRFVDLSPLTDPALVAKTVAVAFGIEETASHSLTDTISDHLGERRLLLLLDNCEHLTEECARFATALLQHCPHVRILATSRQRLGVTGETVQPVPPLSMPDLKLLQDDEKNAASVLMEYESVRLFVDRAQRVQPNLHLNPPMLRSIALLCRRLDGIPLALELAAARMTVLDPEQIAARLRERFRLLSGGDRAAPARLRTLRAALDWSYDLLQPEEQALLRRLSVFVGGWTLEAAEAVCSGKSLEEWEVLDCLVGLADHSLIVVEPQNGQTRYRLLETMREYGKERLREEFAEESVWLRAKHREYFLQFVQDTAPYVAGPEQALWLDRQESEHDNLRTALDGCLEEGTAGAIRLGQTIAGGLRRLWGQRGHVSEGRRWYAALLSRDPAPDEPSPERGRALEGAGILAYRQADYTVAKEILEEALSLQRQLGNRSAQATPYNVLGSIALEEGDYPRARSVLEQALALHRETDFRHGEAAVLNTLGLVAYHQGDFTEARMLLSRALSLCQEVGDVSLEASILNRLGMLVDTQNDLPTAQTLYERALTLNRDIADYRQMIGNLNNLADNADRQGDPARAEAHYREALLLTRELGESHNLHLTADLLTGMATMAVARSHPERAARLQGASDALREITGSPRLEADVAKTDQFVAELRTLLGEATFTALWEEGHLMRVDQAVDFALER